MTADQYRRRIEHLAHVCAWSASNPFRAIATSRLEGPGLSHLGGCHAAPPHDASVLAEETAVALMRAYPASVTEPSAEF